MEITIELSPEARQAVAGDIQAWGEHRNEMERAMLVLRGRCEILLQEQGRQDRVPITASFALTDAGLVIASGDAQEAPTPVNRAQRRRAAKVAVGAGIPDFTNGATP